MGAAGEAGLAEAERAEPVVAAVEEGEEPEAVMAKAGPAAELILVRGRRGKDSRRSDSAARRPQRCSRGWRRRPARISHRGSTGSERCCRRRRGWRCMAAERRAAAAPVEEAWWVEVALAIGRRRRRQR